LRPGKMLSEGGARQKGLDAIAPSAITLVPRDTIGLPCRAARDRRPGADAGASLAIARPGAPVSAQHGQGEHRLAVAAVRRDHLAVLPRSAARRAPRYKARPEAIIAFGSSLSSMRLIAIPKALRQKPV